MATQLWKDGKCEFFQTENVNSAIKSGWSPTNKKPEVKPEVKKSTK